MQHMAKPALGAEPFMSAPLPIALNCNKAIHVETTTLWRPLPATVITPHRRCPVGAHQEPRLVKTDSTSTRGAERDTNWSTRWTAEVQTSWRGRAANATSTTWKPEDLRALTLEASMITGVPLAGTTWFRRRAG